MHHSIVDVKNMAIASLSRNVALSLSNAAPAGVLRHQSCRLWEASRDFVIAVEGGQPLAHCHGLP